MRGRMRHPGMGGRPMGSFRKKVFYPTLLQQLREDAGMSRKTLAGFAKVPSRVIEKIEHRDAIYELRDLARALRYEWDPVDLLKDPHDIERRGGFGDGFDGR